MSTFTKSTESKTESETKIPTPTEIPTPVPASTEVEDYGYGTETPPKPATEVTPPVVETPPAPVKKPLTGYGETPPEEKVETPAPVEKPVDPATLTEEEKTKKEFSELVKALPEAIDKDKLTKFALDNKFTKEQLEAYTKLVKEDLDETEKSQKENIKVQRNQWKTELMNDPEFGGENFDKNVDRVEKVLQNFMPNTKKVLTERGSVLPPYIMRDYLALSKILNPVAPLVTGDPGEAEDNSRSFLDEMYK